MLPMEEACFSAVLRACQDHADALLARGDPPRPTALMAHIEHGCIRSAALAHMDMLDEFAVTRFVQETVAHPDIDVIVRTHNEEEAALLRNESLGTVFLGDTELARGMAAHVLLQFKR